MASIGPGVAADPHSSSRMVPTARSSSTTAPDALRRLTTNVSSSSIWVSPVTATVTGRAVSPGAKVTVPEPAAKSVPGAAVPPSPVRYWTVTVSQLSPSRETAKVAAGPASPSATTASPIDTRRGVTGRVTVADPSAGFGSSTADDTVTVFTTGSPTSSPPRTAARIRNSCSPSAARRLRLVATIGPLVYCAGADTAHCSVGASIDTNTSSGGRTFRSEAKAASPPAFCTRTK